MVYMSKKLKEVEKEVIIQPVEDKKVEIVKNELFIDNKSNRAYYENDKDA